MGWRCGVCAREFARKGSAKIHAGQVHDLSPSEALAQIVDAKAPANAPSAPAAAPPSSTPAPAKDEDDWWW